MVGHVIQLNFTHMRKSCRIGMCFLILFLLGLQFQGQAQNKKFFIITGKIVPEQDGIGTGVIEITKNGTLSTPIEIPKNGRFRFELEFFNEYQLNFKYPGHFSKIISVSTVIPQEVWERDNDFPPFPMIVQLSKEFEGIDKSFTLKPTGRIFYGKDIDNFEKESFVPDLSLVEQIENAKAQAAKVKKDVQTISKESAQELAAKQKDFDQILKEADALYQRGEFQMALLKYLDARKLFPDKAYPNDRIAELQDLVKALENTKKQKEELDRKYQEAIARANGLFDQKSYPEARPVYESALQYKPGDVFANGRIREIDDLMALLAKQKQYNELIAQADKDYKAKDFDKAIESYNQANKLSPQEQYPQSQIALINKEKADQLKSAQLDADFNAAMEAGNNFGRQKDHLQALAAFKRALSLKSDNKLAQDKIAETELAIVAVESEKKYQQAIQLADQALAAGDLQKAKTQFQEALNLKPEETYPNQKLNEIALTETLEKQFQDLIVSAESAFAAQKLQESLKFYSDALVLKPKETGVQTKITELKNLLAVQAADQEYANLIAQADKAFENDQLEVSLSDYSKAMQLKKNEQYPKAQIKRIEDYSAKVKVAEKQFASKELDNAMASYNAALVLKPNDALATAKLAEIKKALDEQKQLEERQKAEQLMYANAIAAADQLFNSANYTESIQKYREASGIKPSESYPTKRIKEIETILDGIAKENARKEKEFQTLIARADKSFTAKEYPNATADYQKALEFKPENEYALSQIRKIEDIVKENKRLEEERLKQLEENKRLEAERQRLLAEKQNAEFAAAMANGDKAFQASDFELAKSIYQSALTIKPNDPEAKKKLSDSEARQAQLVRMSQAYSKAIDEANQRLTAKQYTEAKEKYQEALQYKADAEYPKTQITKIDELLARQLAEAKLQKDYNDAVTSAEQFFRNKELRKAKETFMVAYNLIPSESLPPQRIKEIDALLAAQADRELEAQRTLEAYKKVIERADRSFGNKDYSSAKLIYNEALLVKSDEKYPVEQLELIEKLLKEQNEQLYKTAIAKADAAFNAKNYDLAVTTFQEALTFRKDDAYANKRLKDIAQLKAGLEAEQNRLKKLDEQYSALLVAANSDLGNKAYQEAKAKYQSASGLKPAETYPKEQIAKIDGILAELAKEADTNSKYTELIKIAQDEFKANRLKEARATFQKAYNLKPFEPLPPMRIAEIDRLLAQQAEAEQLAAMEKAHREAKERADRLQYDNAIAAADKAFAEKVYKIARAHYITALNALPDEKYPKDQIAKIDALVEKDELEKMLAVQKAQQDSLLAAKEKVFNQLMATAREFDRTNQYQSAISKYREALAVKPDQKPVIDKLISDLNDKIQILARKDQEYSRLIALADSYFAESKLNEALTEYQNAVVVKADEAYPKQQIREIQSRLTAQEENYSRAINQGDKFFDASEWQSARKAYTDALAFKPNEKYPADRLRETNQKISEANLASLNNAVEDKAYNEAIALAERAMNTDNLTTARMQYEVARTLKPAEKLPSDRIREIDALIAQREREKQLNAQRETDEKYRQAISVADNSFREKSYTISKLQYQQALIIKPEESYPKTQIALIDKLLKESLPVETYSYKLPEIESAKPEKPAAVRNATESAELTASRASSFVGTTDYSDAVSKADKAFGINDYSVARFYYYKATELKPSEDYPRTQIELIRKLIDSQLSSGDNSGYEQAILQADEAFSRKNYNVAKFYYYKALGIKSWEQYPKDRINEILALTNSLLSEREEREYRELIAKADEAYFNKDVAISRFYYNKAIAMKKDEEYPRIKLKDIQKLIEQDMRDQENQQYRNLIEEGDRAFEAKNYSIARFNYNKALSVKPNDSYPKDQLKKIKEELDKR